MKNQVPDYKPEENQGFIPDAINRSTTPIRVVPPDGSTTITTEDCWGDPIAQQVKMTKEEQLAFRCRAMNSAKPNSDPSLAGVGFEAGEVED